MRKSIAFAILSSVMALAACDNAAKTAAPEPAAPAAPPPPEMVSLNGCIIPAEIVATERLVGPRNVQEKSDGSYTAQLKGETSGEAYNLTCAAAAGVTDLITMQSARSGGVNKADLVDISPTLANPATFNVGEEVAIPITFALRGKVSADGFVNDFFGAARFTVPADGNYCFGVTAKFAAAEGKGSTNYAVDDGAWQIWGHQVEDGVVFNDNPAIPLTVGEHVIYLQKREDVVSKFRVKPC